MGKWKVLKAKMRIRLEEERGTCYLLQIEASSTSITQERDGRSVWLAQTAVRKEMAILSDVQTTLIRKEKLAGAQQPNLQEYAIPTADSGTVR